MLMKEKIYIFAIVVVLANCVMMYKIGRLHGMHEAYVEINAKQGELDKKFADLTKDMDAQLAEMYLAIEILDKHLDKK